MAVFSALAGLTLFGANVLGLSFAGATLFATATIGIGASLLGGLAGMAFAGQQPTMKTSQAQATINQSTGPRLRGYGRVLLGGTRAFWDSVDGDLYQAVMIHSGEVDAIEDYKVGDKWAILNAEGDVDMHPYANEGNFFIRIRGHLGVGVQSANSMLTAAFSQWTSDHRLQGIAYFVTRFRSPSQEEYQQVFPDGYNTPVRALCRLSKVYDPRTSTTAWSDNAALVIRDYLTHPDGYRLAASDIDVPSFNAFAGLCDEDVARSGGGSENRYRIWGVYQLTDEPHAILRKMLNTCDGELYQTPEGKIAIRGGKWEAPTVTIDGQHILGHSMEQGNNRFSAFNELKLIYTSPDHDYQSTEATAWVDVADQAERGVIASDIDLDFVPSPAQARRAAKMFQYKANPRWKGRVVTDAYGLMALGERSIRVVIPELEIDEAFFVAGLRISPDLSSVEIEVSTIRQEAYDWNAATEEGANPPVPADTSPDLTFPVPENPVLTSPGSGQVLLTVDDPERSGLTLEAQIRAGAGANWGDMETESQITARENGLGDGDYQARARWRGAGDVAGAWSFPLAEITIPVPE